MRRRATSIVSLTVLAAACAASIATNERVANAAWPPALGQTPAQLEDPSDWPNDPDYSGLWQYWSWIPPHDAMHPLRPGETATGLSVDVAWEYTIGDPRVKIAVLDSGIEWDSPDLVHKIALNAAELVNAKPLTATGTACGGTGALAGFDCDGNGVFDQYDYEVSKQVQTPTGIKTFHDANNNGMLDPGDLIVMFSDGKDDDNNGFVDDIAGWDFFKDDNDPYDDTRYGHGTGEAHDSSAEGNNHYAGLGGCPKCQVIPLRCGDSFIVDVNDFAQAVTYATDNGVSVIQEALGAINQSNLSRAAIDYAYGKNITIIASAADENSRHHNMPGTTEHTVPVHAIEPDSSTIADAYSYVNFHPCSNFGGQVFLSVSGTGCASEATGRSSGVTGLIYSMAMQQGLTLHAEEVRQLLIGTADIINVPQSYDPTVPGYDPAGLYPSQPNFSQRFGYGRVNAGSAMKAIASGAIPPEVEIQKPSWFEDIYVDRLTADVPIVGRIVASRAATYDATVQWAPGVEPEESAFKVVATIPSTPGTTSTGADGTPLGFLKQSDLAASVSPDTEIENQHTFTVRIQVTAHYGGTIGDVKGEARKTLYALTDPTLLPAFPIHLGASGEGSPRLHDFDGDGTREILYPTSDGLLHLFKADGSELAGWPVSTRRMDGLVDGAEYSPLVAHYISAGVNNAWTRGDMKLDLAHESIDPSAPAIGDIDGDGVPDIVFASWAGTIYAVHADGSAVTGWPVRLPMVPSCPRGEQPALPAGTDCMDLTHDIARGMGGGVVLADIDKDGLLDVIAAAFDGRIHAFDKSGNEKPNYPVSVHYTGDLDPTNRYSRVVTTPAVGDVNGDGIPEIAVGSGQYLGSGGQAGAFYLVDGRGNAAPGGACLPGWPVVVSSFKLFPLIGEGIVSAGMMADIDGDGIPEVIFHGTGAVPVVLPVHPIQPSVLGANFPNAPVIVDDTFGSLYVSPQNLPGNNMIPVFSQPSVGDLDQDGKPDIVAYGASFFLALAISGSSRQNYEQQMAMWSGATVPCDDDSTLDDAGTRKCMPMFPGSPVIIEDYTFFHNGSIADVSGDDYPEALVGTGGYYVHANDACGREAPGFPKFTGQWIIPTPTVGDVDGDGTLEVVTGTRDGWLYAWHTQGREDGVLEWPTHHHDDRNTGNYATPIDFPKAHKAAKPLDLTTCASASASASTSASTSASATTEPGDTVSGGSCVVRATSRSESDGSTERATIAVGSLAAMVGLIARRRRSRARRR